MCDAAQRRRLFFRWISASVALAFQLGSASAGPREEAARQETATCVAVMQTHADTLARSVKAGDKSKEAALRSELERAAALIGRTYLDGLQDPAEAKARLQAAQERQAGWDDARRGAVRQSCVKKADAELAAASGAERFLVARVAQARLKRMLEQH